MNAETKRLKVLLLCRHSRRGSSSRLRMLQYLPYLEARGVDVAVSSLFNDRYLDDFYGNGRRPANIIAAYLRRLVSLLGSRRYDLLWIEKDLFPYLPGLAEHMLAVLRIPYVVDYDDATFHHYDRNFFSRAILGKKIGRIMCRAALVVAGNEYIMEHAMQAGAKRIKVIPTVVDIDRYPVSYKRKEECVRIGWIGCPETSRYLLPMQNILAHVCAKGDVKFIAVGSGPLPFDDVNLEIRDWCEDREAEDVSSFDVGIMPLDETDFELGKCGYKLIQYMAAGKPVIATSIGINSQIVDHGVDGFLAKDSQEWIDAIEALKGNEQMRIHMGAAGRKKVEEKYNLNVTGPKLYSALCEAAGMTGAM